MFQSTMTKCGGRSFTDVHGGGAVGDRTHHEPHVGQSLTEGFDCGNIPIDDEYLFSRFGGEHKRCAIRDSKLYSTLTVL